MRWYASLLSGKKCCPLGSLPTNCSSCYAQVKVRTDVLTKIKDDMDLTQKLLDEESVFVLPGQVRTEVVATGLSSN
jgi:aspartate/methionine/tyrosine aminotransferase